MKTLQAIVLLTILSSSLASAQDTPVLEGYVFDAISTAPLYNAEVQLLLDGAPLGRTALTDSNGYFLIEISTADIGREVQIVATCPFQQRDGIQTYSTGPTHPYEIREGAASRNFYIKIPGSRQNQRCRRVFYTQ